MRVLLAILIALALPLALPHPAEATCMVVHEGGKRLTCCNAPFSESSCHELEEEDDDGTPIDWAAIHEAREGRWSAELFGGATLGDPVSGGEAGLRMLRQWSPRGSLGSRILKYLFVVSVTGNSYGLELRGAGGTARDVRDERHAAGVVALGLVAQHAIGRFRLPAMGSLVPELQLRLGGAEPAALSYMTRVPVGVMLTPRLGIELQLAMGPGDDELELAGHLRLLYRPRR